MARLWISRILFVYSMLLALLFSFSLQRPSMATTGETLTQAALLVVSVACLVALRLLSRSPRIAARIAGVVGLYGFLMLCLRGGAMLSLVRKGGAQQMTGSLLYTSLWIALILVGVCSVGRGWRLAVEPSP